MVMENRTRPLRLDAVQITDSLFGEYTALVAEKILPYQWDALNDKLPDTEPSYCMENFRIAAGEKTGHHQGAVFQDTDLYKWLEAVAYCIENGSGKQYEAQADEAIALIGRAQQPDGYLNTYITIEHPEKRWKNLAEGHELYSAGHLIEAAVAYYHATGKMTLLQVARRFADLIDNVFGPEKEKSKGYPGHQEIELALVKLYDVTKEKRYLALAYFFIAQRGAEPNYLLQEMEAHGGPEYFPEFAEYDASYSQSHMPPIRQTTAEGHAVRAMYMYSAMADLAMAYDDEALAHACRAIFDNTTERRMYITGGIGSSGKLERFTVDYDLPNETMYCESCASIGLMMFAQRMAALTKDARYYDTVERALCNTVLAGIAKTGDRYFYVNPLAVWPHNCRASTSMSHVKPIRQKWFPCACCPPNIARTLASLGQYIYAVDEDSLYVNQYISSQAKAVIRQNTITLSMEAAYMQDGTVTLHIHASEDTPVNLRVRIPAYMQKVGYRLNGKWVHLQMEKGYAVLLLCGKGDSVLQIAAEVEPVYVAANEEVRADVGRLALMKGPYVYCLEEQDNGDHLESLYFEPEAPIREEAPCEDLPGRLPQLSCPGEKLSSTIAGKALYAAPRLKKKEVRLQAIPYCLWCNRTPGEMSIWLKASI
jgi:DUF1680 family protein